MSHFSGRIKSVSTAVPAQKTPEHQATNGASAKNVHLSRLAGNSATSVQFKRLDQAAEQASMVQHIAQLQGPEEEEPLQGKFSGQPFQRKNAPTNAGGLPPALKTGVEQLSGVSMDDVNVTYNSSKPAQLSALAYAKGNDIHLAAGQEKHLPHEAWHVAQQKAGRVQPTTSVDGVAVNDDPKLEKEADVMGSKANALP